MQKKLHIIERPLTARGGGGVILLLKNKVFFLGVRRRGGGGGGGVNALAKNASFFSCSIRPFNFPEAPHLILTCLSLFSYYVR